MFVNNQPSVEWASLPLRVSSEKGDAMSSRDRTSSYRLECLLVLPEEVVKDGPVLLVYPLHLVDVLGHPLHSEEGVPEGPVGLLLGPGADGAQALQLTQQQGVLQYPLDGLDQVRLQGGGLLAVGVAGQQEVLEGLVALT